MVLGSCHQSKTSHGTESSATLSHPRPLQNGTVAGPVRTMKTIYLSMKRSISRRVCGRGWHLKGLIRAQVSSIHILHYPNPNYIEFLSPWRHQPNDHQLNKSQPIFIDAHYLLKADSVPAHSPPPDYSYSVHSSSLPSKSVSPASPPPAPDKHSHTTHSPNSSPPSPFPSPSGLSC